MKTKKFFMAIAAMAAVSMSSCSQEEELVSPDNRLSDNAVVFGTYIGKNPASRGSVINTDALKDNGATGFGVMAYYTEENNFGAEGSSQTPNFMYNQQVKWTGEGTTGAWTYSPLKYWPNNNSHKISFFAYAPYVSNVGTECITALSGKNASGAPTLTFKMSTDVSKHIDLLYADATDNDNKIKNLTNQSTKVKFKFKHALSRISFYRQALIDDNANTALDKGTTITIKKVTFKAVNLATQGTLNLNTGTWSNLSYGDNTYEIVWESEKSDESSNSANVLTSDNATEVLELTSGSDHIMFIPVANTSQSSPVMTSANFPASRAEEETSTSTSTITIVYKVETTDKNLNGSKSTVENTATVNVPSISFSAGKAYNFLLKIGMKSVQLAASVEDWPDTKGENGETNWESNESGDTNKEVKI